MAAKRKSDPALVASTSSAIPSSSSTLVPIKQEYAGRTIHYFDIHFSFNDDAPQKQEMYFLNLFHQIAELSRVLDPNRHWLSAGRRYFVKDASFDGTNKTIQGKLCSIRMDLFPELGKASDDTSREIEADEDEGILETAHFIITYSNRVKHIALEYNDVGPKAADMRFYLEHMGQQFGLQKVAMLRIISSDTLQEIERRMGRISEMDVRVYKGNVGKIAKMNRRLASVLTEVEELFDSDIITLKPKYEYKKKTATANARDIVDSVVRAFAKNQTDMDSFEVFRVKAEDRDKNGNLDDFDLLQDKIRSRIKVQKRPRSRVLISADVFDKMSKELAVKRLI